MEYASVKYLRRLDNIIKGNQNIPEIGKKKDDTKGNFDEDDDDTYFESILDSQDSTTSSWIDWTKQIYDEAEEIAAETVDENLFHLNLYNIPNAAKMFKDLMFELPLWTPIMYSTLKMLLSIHFSAVIEGEFSKLKRMAFDKLPLTVEKFVFVHLKWLEGETKLLAPKMMVKKCTKKTEKRTVTKAFLPPENLLDEEENWRV